MLDAALDEIRKATLYFEKKFNIDTNSIFKIDSGNDWAFIIKAHALMEGVVNHLYACYVNINFEEHFSLKLQLRVKLDFLKKEQIITKENYNFIKSICRLRNRLVHSVSNLDFNFEKSEVKFHSELQSVGSGILGVLPNMKTGDTGDWYRINIMFVSIVVVCDVYTSIEENTKLVL